MKSATTKMKANRWQFRLPWQCSHTIWGASLNRACPGLHWKPLLYASISIGKCLCRITQAAAMVNEFVENTQNTNKTQLLASNYGTFRALVVCDNFIPQNKPSTQLIDATSFV